MSILHPNAMALAQKYIGSSRQLELLGWGIEGDVYTTPEHMTAIKVHTRQDGFIRELAVYRRLDRYKVKEIDGFSIPQLVNSNSDLQVIEMSTVKKPWLLDFSSARLDKGPDFTVEANATWWQQIEERFGERFAVVQSLYWALVNRYGIYYGDLKYGNIEFV